MRSWLYGASCPGKKAACFVEQPWKMINFICKEVSDSIEAASLHSPSQASSVSMLVHFHKTTIQMGQPIKKDRMLFWAGTYLGISQKKINMAAVNMSNLSGPIICVNSQSADTEWFSTFAVFYTKPMIFWQKTLKNYLQVITDLCVKISVLEIYFEEKTT